MPSSATQVPPLSNRDREGLHHPDLPSCSSGSTSTPLEGRARCHQTGPRDVRFSAAALAAGYSRSQAVGTSGQVTDLTVEASCFPVPVVHLLGGLMGAASTVAVDSCSSTQQRPHRTRSSHFCRQVRHLLASYSLDFEHAAYHRRDRSTFGSAVNPWCRKRLSRTASGRRWQGFSKWACPELRQWPRSGSSPM